MNRLTAVYKKMGSWYLGWIEEIPGVNTQGKTMPEVKQNLQEALQLVIETNRWLSQKDSQGNKVVREKIPLPA